MRYLRYLKYIIIIAFFPTVFFYYNKSADVARKESAEYLQNNVKFEGYVTDFKQSNNHAFGVIYLKLTKSNTQQFNKILPKGIYPYKIKGDIAELYTTIPDGLQKSDIYIIISNAHEYRFIDKSDNISYVSDLYIIVDPYDIDFVNANTLFK